MTASVAVETVRVSRYLNVIDLDSSCLLFNGATGVLDEVSRELGAALRRGDEGFLVALGAAGLGFLRRRGHVTGLTPEGEKERFRAYAHALHERNAAASPGVRSLMLLTSYECNLACSYCYQQMHRGGKAQPVMTVERLDQVFGSHLQSLTGGALESIVFYGGEPFLPRNEGVVRRALGHAKRLGLSARAVSNATHVHQMADCFGPEVGQVSEVQVSLDGDKAAHDATRVTRGGGATFERIIENILLLLARGARAVVRINMARERLHTLSPLMDLLRARGIAGHRLATIYTHPVHGYIGAGTELESLMARDLSAAAERAGGLSHPIKRKSDGLAALLGQTKGAALRRTSYCMQPAQSTVVVDPYGDIYSCYEEAGHRKLRIGALTDSGVEHFPRRDYYRARHVGNMEKCVVCPVALACGGGCGTQAYEKNGDYFEPHCPGEVEDILEAVRRVYVGQAQGVAREAATLEAPEL